MLKAGEALKTNRWKRQGRSERCGRWGMPETWAYWPVLGLVDGPGFVPGVGLVVLGVSVPVPPMLEPLLDAPPELLGELMLPAVPEVPEVPEVPDVPDVPEVPAAPVEPMLPDVPEVPDVPELPDMPELPDVPDDVPELPLLPEPEPPPVMPAQALNSAAQAITTNHLFM